MKKYMGKFYINNTSALTIVEVLVAIILTAIVMLHGTMFFISTWRLSAESKEYNMILNDVITNLENYSMKAYSTSVNISSSTDYYIYRRILRGKTVDEKKDDVPYYVRYELKKDTAPVTNGGGFYYIISSAKWRYGGDYKSDIVISIKTARAPRW